MAKTRYMIGGVYYGRHQPRQVYKFVGTKEHGKTFFLFKPHGSDFAETFSEEEADNLICDLPLDRKVWLTAAKWHGGIDTPLYAIASSGMAGRCITVQIVRDAIHNIKLDLKDTEEGPARREFVELMNSLEMILIEREIAIEEGE